MWNGGFYGYGPSFHSWHWMWFGHSILSTLFTILLVGLVVRLVYRRRSYRGDMGGTYRSAFWRPDMAPDAARGVSPGLVILEERYAKGEIGRDEYLQKRQDLMR